MFEVTHLGRKTLSPGYAFDKSDNDRQLEVRHLSGGITVTALVTFLTKVTMTISVRDVTRKLPAHKREH